MGRAGKASRKSRLEKLHPQDQSNKATKISLTNSVCNSKRPADVKGLKTQEMMKKEAMFE